MVDLELEPKANLAQFRMRKRYLEEGVLKH